MTQFEEAFSGKLIGRYGDILVKLFFFRKKIVFKRKTVMADGVLLWQVQIIPAIGNDDEENLWSFPLPLCYMEDRVEWL